jgi:hypothetical protein
MDNDAHIFCPPKSIIRVGAMGAGRNGVMHPFSKRLNNSFLIILILIVSKCLEFE